MRKATGLNNPEVVVNCKWDGGSGALRFKSGKLYKALTRGTGTEGEDITQNVGYCVSKVWGENKSFSGEVRGELIITNKGFEDLNQDGRFQNARNLLSGSLKILNLEEFIPRASSIKFYAYWLEDSKNAKYSEDFETMKKYGFEVGDYFVCKSLDEIKAAIEKIEKSKYDVAIDGAVMKLNEKKFWDTIGSTSKFPRWAKAYKYEQTQVETTVVDIIYGVGRTGKITPKAILDPVFIDGSTVSKATLNNKDWMDALNIGIGDKVLIQKAAAIIPEIVEVIDRKNRTKKASFPKKCPACGSVLVKHDKDHADFYCDSENCPEKTVDRIINFTSCMKIDGFAEIVTTRMYEAGILKSIEDLLKISENKFKISKLERMSVQIAETLAENIENSKKNDPWKLLAGFGIKEVGPKTAKLLMKHFSDIRLIIGATEEELQQVEGVGEIVAKSIKDFFSKTENRKMFETFSNAGFKTKINVQNPGNNLILEGKNFVITGALSKPRSHFQDIIESLGGKLVGAISNSTSFLLTNDKTSGTTKNKKAKELGIPVINEEEFFELCKSAKIVDLLT